MDENLPVMTEAEFQAAHTQAAENLPVMTEEEFQIALAEGAGEEDTEYGGPFPGYSDMMLNTTPGQYLTNIAGQIAKPAGGALELLESGLSYPTSLVGIDQPLGDVGNKIREQADYVMGESRKNFGITPETPWYSPKALSFDIPTALGAMAPVMGSAALKLGPTLAMRVVPATYGTLATGDKYSELKDRGYSDTAALPTALAYGYATSKLERLPTEKILGAPSGRFGQQVFQSAGAEGIEEMGQEMMDIGIDLATDPEMDASPMTLLSRIGHAGTVGAGAGGTAGGLMSLPPIERYRANKLFSEELQQEQREVERLLKEGERALAEAKERGDTESTSEPEPTVPVPQQEATQIEALPEGAAVPDTSEQIEAAQEEQVEEAEEEIPWTDEDVAEIAAANQARVEAASALETEETESVKDESVKETLTPLEQEARELFRELPPEEQQALQLALQRFQDETGAVLNPFGSGKKPIQGAKELVMEGIGKFVFRDPSEQVEIETQDDFRSRGDRYLSGQGGALREGPGYIMTSPLSALRKMADSDYKDMGRGGNETLYKIQQAINDVLQHPRQWLVLPRRLAKMEPLFQPVYNAGRWLFGIQETTIYDSMEMLAPFANLSRKVDDPIRNLSPQSRVNKALIYQRIAATKGEAVNEKDPAAIKRTYGLKTEEELSAYYSVREFTNHSLGLVQEALLTDIPAHVDTRDKIEKYKKDVVKTINKLRKQYYVPFSRFGKYKVYTPSYTDPETGEKVGYFSLHETMTDARNRGRALKAQGYKDTQVGEIIPGHLEGADMLPPDILLLADEMGALADDPRIDVKYQQSKPELLPGFVQHLEQASLMPGFSTDLDRALSRYALGLSYWHAQKVTAPKFRRLLEDIKQSDRTKKNIKVGKIINYTKPSSKGKIGEQTVQLKGTGKNYNPTLHKYTSDYVEYLRTGHDGWGRVRKLTALYHLSKLMSPMVNLTQFMTMASPTVGVYIKNPEEAGKTIGKSITSLTALVIKDPKNYSAHIQELSDGLHEAVKAGYLSQEHLKFMTASAKGKPDTVKIPKKIPVLGGQELGDLPMIVFAASEKANRFISYAMGFEVATKLGMDGDARRSFAEDFVLDTQGDYSRANRPKGFRGNLAIIGQFKMFPLIYMNWLRELMGEAAFGSLLAALGVIVGLGGWKSVPGIKETIMTAERMGFDPALLMRTQFKKMGTGDELATALMYGLGGWSKFMRQHPLMAKVVPEWTENVNLSGSLSAMDIAPNIEYGAMGALARLLIGPSMDPLTRAGRAMWIKNEHDDPGKYLKGAMSVANEQFLPPALRGVNRARRWEEAQGFQTSTGDMLIDRPPTTAEKVMTAIGMTPLSMALPYEKRHSSFLIDEKYRDNENINRRLANNIVESFRASQRGNKEEAARYNQRAREIVQESIESFKGKPIDELYTANQINSASVLRSVKEQLGGDVARALRYSTDNIRGLSALLKQAQIYDLIDPRQIPQEPVIPNE